MYTVSNIYSIFGLSFVQCDFLTYLPHKAVAEVSKDKKPIGRECAEFNWFESPLMSGSNEWRVKWFGCHLIWDSNDLVVNRCVLQMILVVCWFELQVMWLSIDLRFKWFGCQLIWDSSVLVVNRFEIQTSWLSIDLRFKWFGCQMVWGSSDLDVKWFEVQVIWLSTDVWCKWFCQTKLFCEISFKT